MKTSFEKDTGETQRRTIPQHGMYAYVGNDRGNTMPRARTHRSESLERPLSEVLSLNLERVL